MMDFDAKRIRRAMKKAFASAREHLADARECRKVGYDIGVKAHLEEVSAIRKRNATRRLALKVGHRV